MVSIGIPTCNDAAWSCHCSDACAKVYSTCVDSNIAVPISMFVFLYGLLCILSKTLKNALEYTLFGIECPANIVSLEQLDLKVPMQQHHCRHWLLSQKAKCEPAGVASERYRNNGYLSDDIQLQPQDST